MPPTNDAFAGRQVIDLSANDVVAVAFDLDGSTLESGEQDSTGMAGSVWFQIQSPTDEWVLFDVPAGVEVRRYRGTATLAGMLPRGFSNDAARAGFNMSAAFTYFVKLQSTTATESGVMYVRPYAWTDYQTAPVVQGGPSTSYETSMDAGQADTTGAIGSGFSSEAALWSFLLAGPDETGDYGSAATAAWSVQHGSASSSLAWRGSYRQLVIAMDFAASGAALAADGRPTSPYPFDNTLVSNLDYATDPITGHTIEYETTAAGVLASGDGQLAADGVLASSGGAGHGCGVVSGGANVPWDTDFWLRAVTPPNPASAQPAWPGPSSGGIAAIHLHHSLPGGVLTTTVSGGRSGPYDVASLLDGTRLAFVFGPDAAEPVLAQDPVDGSCSGIMQVGLALSQVTIPVQYPRYRIYAPKPVPVVTRAQRLRQYPRPTS